MRKQALLLAACAPLFVACASDPPATYPPNRPAPPTGTTADPSVNVEADSNSYADTDPSALTDFHSALDAHGTWVEDPTYGTVWVPASETVGTDFAPYNTHGHWAYDNDEYVWVSDYDWGWAPFHYGRWTYVNDTGWAWIPGRTYAGAWVEWRDGGAANPYVGWAPVPPSYGWRGGVAVALPAVPSPQYVYTQHGDLFAPGIHDHLVGSDHVAEIAAHTTPYGGPTVAGGSTAGPSGSRTFTHPIVSHGPPPAQLGIPEGSVTHVTRGVASNGAGPTMTAGATGPIGARSAGGNGSGPTMTPGATGPKGAHSAVNNGSGPTVAAGGPNDLRNSATNNGASPTPSTGAAGIDKAQAFAHPNTAVAAGGHAPTAHIFRPMVDTQSKAPASHYVAASAPHTGPRTGVRRK